MAEEEHVSKSELRALDQKVDRVHEQLSFELRANGIQLDRLNAKLDTILEMLGTLATKKDFERALRGVGDPYELGTTR